MASALRISQFAGLFTLNSSCATKDLALLVMISCNRSWKSNRSRRKGRFSSIGIHRRASPDRVSAFTFNKSGKFVEVFEVALDGEADDVRLFRLFVERNATMKKAWQMAKTGAN